MKERVKQKAPSICPITVRKNLKKLKELFTKMKAEHLTQHEADLREWKKEKHDDEY